MNRALIGGQAVIEGVTMRASRSLAVAVRRADGGVAVLREPLRLLEMEGGGRGVQQAG